MKPKYLLQGSANLMKIVSISYTNMLRCKNEYTCNTVVRSPGRDMLIIFLSRSLNLISRSLVIIILRERLLKSRELLIKSRERHNILRERLIMSRERLIK